MSWRDYFIKSLYLWSTIGLLYYGRVNVFQKMADAFFKFFKQREKDQLLATAYFSEEEMQIMERILEEMHGSDDIEG